ncbi:oligosaccharide repeat unit polymerase [Salinibacter ruber]|uniref:O-antigen polymerase n=1 Tax=Salinibacter ruber TaxID=146919 RepID=UPI00216AABC4|nr:oligosaccharide repeat unit polymerase [Salinibacter ruber]
MFELLLALTAGLIITGTVWGVVRYNDTLHPLVYLLPMAGFIYVYMPVQLYRNGGLQSYFTTGEMEFVQFLILLGVSGLVLGAVYGSRKIRRDPSRVDVLSFVMTDDTRRRLLRLGIILGAIGLLSYSYQLYNVGGFIEAYDSVKGGGWAASGYLRDLDYLIVPAVALVYLSRTDRPMKFDHWCLVGLLSFPFAARGFLTARRGPTFVFFAVLVGGWYLTRRRRPSVPTVAVGGTLIGLLLLALVTFRGQIYLGGSFFSGKAPPTEEVVESSLEWATTPSFGNEYMYGSYVVLNAREKDEHYWGRRYLTQLFVRPIPSSFWPNKYQAVGMEEIKVNAGQLLATDLSEHPRMPKGSAPGFVGSAYVEWGLWIAPVFLFGLGWLYALVWRKTLVEGGLWTVMYLILVSMSVYFVAQSFYAMFYRLLLMGIPPIFGWYLLRLHAMPDRDSLRQKPLSPASA